MSKGKVTVLGINGHIGHHAAQAFSEAGWDVTGFGRSNRKPIAGRKFRARATPAISARLKAAIADADIVVNALNLPYDKWDKGRAEAQIGQRHRRHGRRAARRMMFPATIYNYAATDRRDDALDRRSARRRRAAKSACGWKRCCEPRREGGRVPDHHPARRRFLRSGQ